MSLIRFFDLSLTKVMQKSIFRKLIKLKSISHHSSLQGIKSTKGIINNRMSENLQKLNHTSADVGTLKLVPSSLMRAKIRYETMNASSTNTSTKQSNVRNKTSTPSSSSSSSIQKYVTKGNTENKKQKDQQKKVKIESDNFNSFLQSFGNHTNAKRLKVHQPNCKCTKIQQLKHKFTSYRNDKSDDQSRSLLSSTEYINNRFIVVPDDSTIKSIFVYYANDDRSLSSSNRYDNAKSVLFHETKLLHQICHDYDHHNNETTSINNDNDNVSHHFGIPPSIKISCANCLLEIEPNGFTCILSKSKSTIQSVVHNANQHKKRKNVLHADHVHYLCTIPLQLLLDLSLCNFKMKMAKKKKNDNEMDKMKILFQTLIKTFVNCIEQEGIITNDDPTTATMTKNDDKHVDIDIGYHLSAILRLVSSNNKKNQSQYIMVTLMQHSKSDYCVWEVNIPGGKRHLGESSWQCAIRETEEETSLVINDDWLMKEYNVSNDDNCKAEIFRQNRYFFLEAPPDLMMESVTDDPFWKQSKRIS